VAERILVRLFLTSTLVAGTAPFLRTQTAQIAIDRLTLHQFEDGPILDSGYMFVPGETAYLSCRLTGYHVEKTENAQQVKLAWQTRVTDPSGVLIEQEKAGRIEERVLPQDKNWMPKFLVDFVVPAFAPSGVYHVSVRVSDALADAEASQELTFHVQGHNFEPSEALATRNFHFFRGESDPAYMISPIYHPGEMLWARFDIIGFKFADRNRFSVDYGLAVLNGDGEQLFAQPDAAADSQESFYPQRYVPGVLSLNLDANVAKGDYILVVTVQDKIGNQSFALRQPFQVQ
jgi:hypothetical protein